MTEGVSKFIQPNFLDINQDMVSYKTAIDNSINVISRVAAAFSVYENSPQNMTVVVNKGTIVIGNAVVEIDTQIIDISDAPTTIGYSRLDRVVLKSDGTAIVLTGTPSNDPVAPSLIVGCQSLAQIKIMYAQNAVTNADIIDERISSSGMMDGNNSITGAMTLFAGTIPPYGWLFSYGQLLSRTEYPRLFSVLGTTYGAGDGITTFALPDMRGRVGFGLDNMGGTDSGRLSSVNTLGQTGGSEKKNHETNAHILTVNEMPSHNHMQGLVIQNGVNTRYGLGYAGSKYAWYDSGGGQATQDYAVLTSTVGGNEGHTHGISNLDVMPPYILLNYIIKI